MAKNQAICITKRDWNFTKIEWTRLFNTILVGFQSRFVMQICITKMLCDLIKYITKDLNWAIVLYIVAPWLIVYLLTVNLASVTISSSLTESLPIFGIIAPIPPVGFVFLYTPLLYFYFISSCQLIDIKKNINARVKFDKWMTNNKIDLWYTSIYIWTVPFYFNTIHYALL